MSAISGKSAVAVFAILLAAGQHAHADWRTDLGTFRIGILDGEAAKLSPGELERMRSAYADALKMPVEIIRSRDFSALIDAHASSRIDYAIYSTTAYASAVLACECVEPIANAVMSDGTTGTRTVIFLAQGVNLASLASSKGVALSKASMTSFGTILSGLPAALPGFNAAAPWIVDTISLDAASEEFKKGTIDGFVASVPDDRKLSSALLPQDPLFGALNGDTRKIAAVWMSEPIANGPHAVRQNLDTEAKQLLGAFLEGLGQKDPDLNDMLLPDGAVSFRKVNAAAYATAVAATKALVATVSTPAQ